MARTTHNVSRPGFIVDPNSVDLLDGRQIDWDTVAAGWANSAGKKELPGGTVMVEQADGTIIPRVDQGDADMGAGESIAGLLATAAVEDSKTAALSGYGVIRGGIVYEDLLPDSDNALWADAGVNTGPLRDELIAAGKGFDLQPYSDNRAS